MDSRVQRLLLTPCCFPTAASPRRTILERLVRLASCNSFSSFWDNGSNPSGPVHRSASSETLPQYTPADENRESDAAPLYVDTPLVAGPSSKPGSFLNRLKKKMIVSEAERQRKELEKQEYLARVAKRRAEVMAEPKLAKNGGKGELYGIGSDYRLKFHVQICRLYFHACVSNPRQMALDRVDSMSLATTGAAPDSSAEYKNRTSASRRHPLCSMKLRRAIAVDVEADGKD
ncbi:hypothetical protein C8R45DRAFT_1066953 [Mycena sanguinolenta]|nr:hypothetical protein C8R45DRAFT_1066953 [Mycena sanguinolenta]